jgi:excinuclease ABC subunit C
VNFPTQFNAKSFLKSVSTAPGVYQMLAQNGEVLYVGKARNLKNRLNSYFQKNLSSVKTKSLVQQIHQIETIITRTENEALILENNLIKKFHPRYNILFRDDKSYPYIVISNHPDYPRIGFYRGRKREAGSFFGPYSSTTAVRETINLLEKIFKLRSCEDNFFRNRSRPCLQYQIKRCTGPCVKLISPEDYRCDVRDAKLFLSGRSQEIIDRLVQRMEEAAINKEFERAAEFRDQIITLRQIQQSQFVATDKGDVDVHVVVSAQGIVCVQVLFIRDGQLLGQKSFFPTVPPDSLMTDVLAAFLPQYYFSEITEHEIPTEIIINDKLPEQSWLQAALTEARGSRVHILYPQRGEKIAWLNIAIHNAQQAITNYCAEHSYLEQRFIDLQRLLNLDSPPQRIECFDISHTGGEATVASCVVFDQKGAVKEAYRRFNIKNIQAGDDYAAIRQAIHRRYLQLKTLNELMPDLVVIDGGKGQLTQAEQIFEELQITGVTLLGIAKGPTRKPGLETLFLGNGHQVVPASADAPGLHLIQQIRDEAHRFAITGHRKQRAKVRVTSQLENIPGIGAKRRRELLRQFGGMQELKNASVKELATVPGISDEMAKKIYDFLRHS